MKYLVFDLETTGVPNKSKDNEYFNYKLLARYEKTRIVSICMLIFDTDKMDFVAELNQLVAPSYGRGIYVEAEAIHKIKWDDAVAKGVPFADLCPSIKEMLTECEMIVSHNLGFDYNILMSELYRCGIDLIELMKTKKLFCTMQAGAAKARGRDTISLPDLFKDLTGKEMEEMHECKHDTLHCFACFEKLRTKWTDFYALGFYEI